jgi:DNA-binding MarR family transcriptional regulator
MERDRLRLDEQLCFPLYAAVRAMTAAYQPLLGKIGLTYPQYLVMLVLWEEEPVTISHLGQRLQLDTGTLSPLLDRMQQDGLVLRERSAADQRRVLIHLTAQGRKLRQKASEVPAAMLAKTGLSPAAARKLRQQINALTEALRLATSQERKSA